MKIELFYFDGCPNHTQALQYLKECLQALSLNEQIHVINIQTNDDANIHRFLGSPSIRVNGKDLEIDEDETTEYSMRCRRYQHGSEMAGHPPKDLILTALQNSAEREKA